MDDSQDDNSDDAERPDATLGDEPYGDQYDLATFVRRVMSVIDAPLRRRQVERHFTTVDPATVASHFQTVLERAVAGESDAYQMLFPIGEFVNTASTPEAHALDAIDLEARKADLHGVAWFLLTPSPAREIDERAMAKMSSQGQSLGHRRTAAGQPDLRTLERLCLDEHPMVIERLCTNPRVTEGHIMTIATRRPTLPVLLETVAASPRWYQRQTVREALVNNPFGPTGIALRALPTLPARAWKSVQHAPQVHEAVRGFAAYLCALRDGESGLSPDSLIETVH